MRAKDVRNLIITLIILLLGIKFVYYIFNTNLSKVGVLSSMNDLLTSLSGLIDLFTYVLIAAIILLIPYYFSKRSDEKKMARSAQNVVPNRPGNKR